ncbi:MAG: ferrous iron transport protein A [Phycisphaerae bacterium]|nr:ferrous iron transport protein A [Phycisphaerae bacterium]
MPLTQLKRGDRAVVDLNDLAPEDTRLLSAMGLGDRCEVRVCRAGTPCIVQVEATRLGISAEVAARILAMPCSCYPDVGTTATSPSKAEAGDRPNGRAS